MRHGRLDHGLTGFGKVLVIGHEPPVPHEPRERSLDHPPARLEYEPLRRLGRDRDLPPARAPHELHEPLGERAIGDHLTHPRQQVPRTRQQPAPAVALLHVGGGHQQRPHQPE